MWRLTAALRLVGLGVYALGLAVLWTLWGALVLVTALLGAGLRLLRVPLGRLEGLIATHRRSWRSLVRADDPGTARPARDRRGRTVVTHHA